MFCCIEQVIACAEKMNIKESAFRALEAEYNNAQKHNDKMNQDKNVLEKNKEKYKRERRRIFCFVLLLKFKYFCAIGCTRKS